MTKSDIINELQKHQADMFYTPKDNEEFYQWLETNCAGNSAMTTALMVGFNYGIELSKKAVEAQK